MQGSEGVELILYFSPVWTHERNKRWWAIDEVLVALHFWLSRRLAMSVKDGLAALGQGTHRSTQSFPCQWAFCGPTECTQIPCSVATVRQVSTFSLKHWSTGFSRCGDFDAFCAFRFLGTFNLSLTNVARYQGCRRTHSNFEFCDFVPKLTP